MCMYPITNIYIYIPLYPIHIPKATSAQPHAGTTGIPL